MTDLTNILQAMDRGEPQAAGQLLPLVYDELRKLAAQRLAQEKPGQTIQATALVHEAYLRLVTNHGHECGDNEIPWDNRGHFFAAAALAMRRILVEQARRKKRVCHGGGMRRIDMLEAEVAITPSDDEQLLHLDEALTRLAAVRPQAAQLVQLRFFAGLTIDEAAQFLDISSRTARRLWVFARAWLRRAMEQSTGCPS